MSITVAANPAVLVTCPFCSEPGFCLAGLKIHLEKLCEVYPKVGSRAPNKEKQ